MKKKQLHEALAVLLTKLSSARDNPLLMDNYVVKALRTVLLEFNESKNNNNKFQLNMAQCKVTKLKFAVNDPSLKKISETGKATNQANQKKKNTINSNGVIVEQ